MFLGHKVVAVGVPRLEVRPMSLENADAIQFVFIGEGPLEDFLLGQLPEGRLVLTGKIDLLDVIYVEVRRVFGFGRSAVFHFAVFPVEDRRNFV